MLIHLFILLSLSFNQAAKCDKTYDYTEEDDSGGDKYIHHYKDCKKGCTVKDSDTSSGERSGNTVTYTQTKTCQKCSGVDINKCGDGCYWNYKKKACKFDSCPHSAKSEEDFRKDPVKQCVDIGEGTQAECEMYKGVPKWEPEDYTDAELKHEKERCSKQFGCLYSKSRQRCSYWAIWALIVTIVVAVVVVVAIIVVIILVVVLGKKTPPAKVTPTNTSPATDKPLGTPINSRSDVVASAEASPKAEVVGPYVIVKMGTHDQRTKSVQNGPELAWGENVVLADLGGEDEDAEFELWDQDTQLAKAVVRIVDYVNNKTHVSVTLKDSSGATLGVLETDIEIKVDEAKNPPEVGAEIFVDKYNKTA